MQYSWDSYPYQNATVEDLNVGKMNEFITKVNSANRFKLPTEPIKALTKLNLLKDEVPTNAAMILFSKKNLLYNVHIGRFKTPSLIVADYMVNGNLYDVLEESMQTIISHLKFAFEITGKTTQRTEIPEYPLEAIREMLVNTLVHRDYTSPTDIQIKIFDNKIIFFNPGGLYGNIKEQDLLTDDYQSSTRNKQIAEAFYLTNDIEKYGSGFIRIRRYIANYPTMQFEFKNTAQGFTTELKYEIQKITSNTITIKDGEQKDVGINVGLENDSKKENSTKKDTVNDTINTTDTKNDTVNDTINTTDTKNDTEKRLEKIIKLIQANPSISIVYMAQKLSVSRITIIRDIEKLKQQQKIQRIGSNKGGFWKITQ